jgi:hypothetical protein
MLSIICGTTSNLARTTQHIYITSRIPAACPAAPPSPGCRSCPRQQWVIAAAVAAGSWWPQLRFRPLRPPRPYPVWLVLGGAVAVVHWHPTPPGPASISVTPPPPPLSGLAGFGRGGCRGALAPAHPARSGFDFGHSPRPYPVWLVLGGTVAVVHWHPTPPGPGGPRGRGGRGRQPRGLAALDVAGHIKTGSAGSGGTQRQPWGFRDAPLRFSALLVMCPSRRSEARG